MKIQNIKGNQTEIPTSYPCVQEGESVGIELRQGPNVEVVDQNISLKEQILAVQKAKTLLGIENLAAANLVTRLHNIGELQIAHFGRNSSVISVLNILLEELNTVTQPEAETFASYDYSYRSQVSDLIREDLLRIACDSSYRIGDTFYVSPTSETRELAAKVLVKILEKMGNYLPSESRMIISLLESPYSSIRRQGAEAAVLTYKHGWRKHLPVELIRTLKNDNDDYIRSQIACAIAHADPSSILKEYPIEGFSEKFCPLSRLVNERETKKVKINLAFGLAVFFEAERNHGGYYKDFNEKPEISAQNKIICFDTVLKILEQLNKKNLLDKDERVLLYFSLAILCNLVDNKAIDLITATPEEFIEYQKIVHRLSHIDLNKFVRDICISCEPDDTARNKAGTLTAISAASPVIDRILLTRANTHEKPLVHYFELKRGFVQMTREPLLAETCTRIVNTSERINDAVESYLVLANAGAKEIKWGDSLGFNLTVKDLLDYFEKLQKDSNKLTVLNLFESINANGVCLSDHGNIDLDNALTSSNRDKLRQVLRTTVYSRTISEELFLSPQTSTPQGRALLAYRRYKSDTPPYKSYKDYYGMNDLKERALETAAQVIVSRKWQKGILLSGEPGTGKSMFAVVLANEVALPLIVVKSSEFSDPDIYLREIESAGCCVVLIDEIERIAKPSNTNLQVFNFLEGLQKLPVIKIATTNSPPTDSIEGMIINEDGTSEEVDKVLFERIHSNCLRFMQPCYFFHKKSVGCDFIRLYLEDLLRAKKIQSSLNIELISNLGRGLIPFALKSAADSVLNSSNEMDKIVPELWRLQSDRPKIITCAQSIKRLVSNLEFEETLKTDGPINYKKIAFVAEDISNGKLEEVLKKATSVINETGLLRLFLPYSDLDDAILPVLERV